LSISCREIRLRADEHVQHEGGEQDQEAKLLWTRR
jgi:hypothetical protein